VVEGESTGEGAGEESIARTWMEGGETEVGEAFDTPYNDEM
jgi:hypothetical protein